MAELLCHRSFFSCKDNKPTEACIAPRHVDASRELYDFFFERAARGGGALPHLLCCSLFPVQQTTSGIGHRVKSLFRVGNQYAKCNTVYFIQPVLQHIHFIPIAGVGKRGAY